MVAQTPRIWRSAARARRSLPVLTPRSRRGRRDLGVKSGGGEVFEGEKAEELLAADGRHWWFRGKAAFVSSAIRRSGARTGGLLVDVGAGGGGVTTMVGWAPDRTIAVEGGAALAAYAHETNGLPTVRAAVAPLPLASGSAAVVCLLDVLEHLDDPGAALAEAARVLIEDGGRLVVNVPAHQWLFSAADEHLGHHLRYNRPGLHRLLEASGFRVLWSSHVFSWLVPPVWLARRRGPALGLDRTSVLIDRMAMVLTAVERVVVGRVPLPLGTSIMCVAEPVNR
jgi:SAM-dependent methyltransferase